MGTHTRKSRIQALLCCENLFGMQCRLSTNLQLNSSKLSSAQMSRTIIRNFRYNSLFMHSNIYYLSRIWMRWWYVLHEVWRVSPVFTRAASAWRGCRTWPRPPARCGGWSPAAPPPAPGGRNHSPAQEIQDKVRISRLLCLCLQTWSSLSQHQAATTRPLAARSSTTTSWQQGDTCSRQCVDNSV